MAKIAPMPVGAIFYGCIINGVDGRNFYQCHFLIKKSWDNKIFLLKLNRKK